MESVFLILNLVFTVLFWKWATECFEDEDRQLVGWFYLIASAINAASFASAVI